MFPFQVLLFLYLSPFQCHSFSPIYNSDGLVCVYVVRQSPSSLKRTETGDPSGKLSCVIPSRSPLFSWGRGSFFLLYWLGIVCRSSWVHRALLTCFFQSREGAACCCPTSGWPCDLLQNTWALQRLQAKGAAINERGVARKENEDELLKHTLWKISILHRAVATIQYFCMGFSNISSDSPATTLASLGILLADSSVFYSIITFERF